MKPHCTKTIVSLIACLAIVVLFAACDASDYSANEDISYAPVAYGENAHCYYVDDIAEISALQRDGLCPRIWTPLIMPLYWHETYYRYYDSAAYYNHYIPAPRRVRYSTVVVRRFETTHKVEITKYSSRAKYKTVVKTSTKTKIRTTTRSQGKTSTTTRTKVSSTSSTAKNSTTRSSGGRGR